MIFLLAHLFHLLSTVITSAGVYTVVNCEPSKEEGFEGTDGRESNVEVDKGLPVSEEGFEGTNGSVLVVMVLVVVSSTSLDVGGRGHGGKGGGALEELNELDVEIGFSGTGGAGTFSISNKRQNFTLSGWYLSSQRKALTVWTHLRSASRLCWTSIWAMPLPLGEPTMSYQLIFSDSMKSCATYQSKQLLLVLELEMWSLAKT